MNGGAEGFSRTWEPEPRAMLAILMSAGLPEIRVDETTGGCWSRREREGPSGGRRRRPRRGTCSGCRDLQTINKCQLYNKNKNRNS